MSKRTFKECRVFASRSPTTVPFYSSFFILSPETPRHRLRTRYLSPLDKIFECEFYLDIGQVAVHLRTVAQLDEGVIESKLTTRSLFAIKQKKSLQ